MDRAREAAGRGEWQQALDLLIEADASAPLSGPDLALLAEVAYAAGHLDVTIDAWERAHAQSVRAGDHLVGGRRGGPGRDAPALRHRADGAGSRVDQAGGTAAGGPGRDAGPRLAGGGAQLRAAAVGRLPERSAMGPAGHRDRQRSAIRPLPPSAGSPRRAASSWPARSRRAWAPQRSGRGRGLRRARSPLHGDRLLRARVCAPGARAVRPGRGVDRGDGAVAPRAARRERPRTLPRPPRRDPPAARVATARRSRKPSWPARSFAPTCAGSSGGR